MRGVAPKANTVCDAHQDINIQTFPTRSRASPAERTLSHQNLPRAASATHRIHPTSQPLSQARACGQEVGVCTRGVVLGDQVNLICQITPSHDFAFYIP